MLLFNGTFNARLLAAHDSSYPTIAKMSATASQSPEPKPASHPSSATGLGYGAPPDQPSGFEAALASDARSKSVLHRLTLVIPLTISIFQEAISHPDSKIKLPLTDLELPVRSVIPIFILIISYMLFRAMCYARIVLWRIPDVVGNLNKITEIAIDNPDAYKINSVYYDEVLDRTAIDLMLDNPGSKLAVIK